MHSYTVVSIEKITATTLLLTLRNANNSTTLEFLPGQYAALQFSRKGRPTPARCFSIVTSPTEQELQFSMRIKGRYTQALSNLKPGDNVKIRGPFGGFIFDHRYDKNVVFIAGGIGITPFMSMIRYATRIKSDSKIALLYSSQSQNDVPFKEEIMKLEQSNPHLRSRFLVTNGPIDALPSGRAISSRLSPELLDQLMGSNFNDKTFFICGPTGFMKTITKTLRSKGVTDDNIVTEAFSQGPSRQSELLRSWPFNMYALTALGLVIATFFVTIGDLLSTLPAKVSTSSSSTSSTNTPTNTRQTELDSLVNNIPPTTTDTSQQTTTTDTTTTTTQTTPVQTQPTQTTPTVRTRLS